MSSNKKKEYQEHDSGQRVRTGEAWADFCDILKAAGQEILDAPEDVDTFDRAEGYRYLSRLTRGALETFIEYSDPQAPVLRRTCHETIKMGADNPDNYYQNAPISNKYRYRLSGNIGSVHDLGFGVQAGNYGKSGDLETTAYLDIRDIKTDEQGNFELILSQEEQEGNWLPLSEGVKVLNIRQTLNDHDSETLASIDIERIDGPHQARPLTAWKLDRGLLGAANFVRGCAKIFHQWTRDLKEQPNELPPFDEETATNAGGVPHIQYYHGYWELKPDEALIIEVTPPQCHFWNFQLNNYWMESLDYRYHSVTINEHHATYESDGSIQLIISPEDPGFGNWIDTCAHQRGTMCLRWVHADEHPQPSTRIVKRSTLNAPG